MRRTGIDRCIQQVFSAEGITGSIVRLNAWFSVPRRTVDYTPVKAAPRLTPRFAKPIKPMIEEEPFLGYFTVAWLLGLQQEVGAADLSAKGLAGPETGRLHAATLPDRSIGPHGAERTLVHEYLSISTGRDGLDFAGARDRLPYPRTAGLASFEIG